MATAQQLLQTKWYPMFMPPGASLQSNLDSKQSTATLQRRLSWDLFWRQLTPEQQVQALGHPTVLGQILQHYPAIADILSYKIEKTELEMMSGLKLRPDCSLALYKQLREDHPPMELDEDYIPYLIRDPHSFQPYTARLVYTNIPFEQIFAATEENAHHQASVISFGIHIGCVTEPDYSRQNPNEVYQPGPGGAGTSAGGSMNFDAGGSMNFDAGGSMNFDAGGSMGFDEGGSMGFDAGGSMDQQQGPTAEQLEMLMMAYECDAESAKFYFHQNYNMMQGMERMNNTPEPSQEQLAAIIGLMGCTLEEAKIHYMNNNIG